MTENAIIASPRRLIWRRGIYWLLLLAPLFFISYGQVNQFTATRLNVGSVVFDWEKQIPFLPWTIIPYWSIDLLYGISLFICTTTREQNRHALRLVMASLLACLGFLLFPLRFSFVRPQTDGVFGWLFRQLEMFDLPYNQAPSLHIMLAWLLWLRFWPHLKPVGKWISSLWFLLIAASVLTTWQHHIIDVFSGLTAGVIVSYVMPMASRWRWRKPPISSVKLAGYYASGAILFALMAGFIASGWALLLIWPAASLMLVALAYGGLGEGIFQKSAQGRHSPSAWLLLWPYFMGAYLSMRWFTRGKDRMTAIAPGLWLGSYPLSRQANIAVLDVTAEFPRSHPVDDHYICCPMLDLQVPSIEQLSAAVEQLDHLYQKQNKVLVHCALGLSRSAMVVAAWLMATDPSITAAQAVAKIVQCRSAVRLSVAHLEVLNQFSNGSVNHVR